MRLTNAVMAENLKVTKPKKIRDDAVQGFYARFSGRGKADFILRYRSPITSKEVTFVLGIYGQDINQLTVLAAREEAKLIRADVDAGHDPHATHKDEVKTKRETYKKRDYQTSNIEVLTKEYCIAVKGQIRIATVKEKNLVMARLSELVGDRLIGDIELEDALNMLDEQETNYGKSPAMKFIQHCSAFWNWALEEGKFKGYNPWANMKGRKKRYRCKPKSRWLDDDELSHLFNELYPRLNSTTQRAVMVCLYTNCRPGMATSSVSSRTGMDWSEIKWSRKEWVLESDRMKAHNEHIVPISDQFYDLLREWWVADGKPDSGPITPAITNSKKYMRGSVYAAYIKEVGATYTPHDFRRTVSTQLQRLGCPDGIRKALRAHVDSSDIAGVYDIHDYLDERREWLQKWADHLDGLGFANLAMKTKQNRLQIELVGKSSHG